MTICHLSETSATTWQSPHAVTSGVNFHSEFGHAVFIRLLLYSLLYLVMSIKIVHQTQGITDAGKAMGYHLYLNAQFLSWWCGGMIRTCYLMFPQPVKTNISTPQIIAGGHFFSLLDLGQEYITTVVSLPCYNVTIVTLQGVYNLMTRPWPDTGECHLSDVSDNRFVFSMNI